MIALGVLLWATSSPTSHSPIGAEKSPTSTATTAYITPSPAPSGGVPADAGQNAVPRERAPWEKTEVPSGSPRIAPALSKAKAYEALQFKMAAMTAGDKTPQAKDLDTILAELQQINGSTEVGGVNLSALRNNLARAEEIQRLGKQMQLIAEAPGKQDLPKLQSLMAEIQRQQAGLVMDVSAKSAGK